MYLFQKATRSYQKDIATAHEVAKANGAPEDGTRGKYHLLLLSPFSLKFTVVALAFGSLVVCVINEIEFIQFAKRLF